MFTKSYTSRKTFVKYDKSRYMVYLNEIEGVQIPDPESQSFAEGFEYTGPEADAGTLIDAKEATYDAFVSGLIRNCYSSDRVEAISINRINALIDPAIDRADEFISEYAALEAYRESCKVEARRLLGMD